MVARAALALGYILQTPLPLSPDDFEHDFATQASRDDFRALLSQASRAFVVESPSSDSTGETATSREAAYELAGRYINANSDLLIAIWDGKEARGRGGTGQVVDEATGIGIPVAWVPLTAPNEAKVLDADGTMHSLDALDAVVQRVLRRQS